MVVRYEPVREDEREEFQPTRFLKAIDTSYEVDRWEAIGVPQREFSKIHFVDGVRFTDLRTRIFENRRFLGEGIFLSLAAGVCSVERDNLGRYDYSVIHPTVERYFVHNAEGGDFPEEMRFVIGKVEVVYKTERAKDLGLRASFLLRRLEKEVVKKLWKGGMDGFTLMDGTVKTRRFVPNAAHLVKQNSNIHLSGEYLDVLFSLKPGERTPAFVFEELTDPKTPEGEKQSIKKVGIYACLPSWNSAPPDNLVRLELPFDEKADPKEVIDTLEKAAAIALKFANHPLRDRRSPQNLTAIAYLEKNLRAYLGNHKLIRSYLITHLNR